MRLPALQGVIDRRILVNYRVDPEILRRYLPPPFTPQLVQGYGIVGVCLIRLKALRPTFVSASLGFSSENAAYRMAVCWPENGQLRAGVYIPRRVTSSRLVALAGGRLFPGRHQRQTFRVAETDQHFRIALSDRNREESLLVEAAHTTEFPTSSVFRSLQEASQFFEQGALGYSDTAQPDRYDGLELEIFDWRVEALTVERLESQFFGDESIFPHGSIAFDCALLMQGIRHRWHSRDRLCLTSSKIELSATPKSS